MAALPQGCRRYLDERGIAFVEVQDGGENGVILKSMRLPERRYDQAEADILVILPEGYPDVPPDMFHTLPWLKFTSSNRYPNAADQPRLFGGQEWQRWSRHNTAWRPGVDGFWTMMKRIETALTEAV